MVRVTKYAHYKMVRTTPNFWFANKDIAQSIYIHIYICAVCIRLETVIYSMEDNSVPSNL